MSDELYVNGKLLGTATNVQMPRFGCTLNPLSDEKELIPAKLYGTTNIEMELSVDSDAIRDVYDKLVAQERGE